MNEDNTPRELIRLVLDKINLLGTEASAAYFEVSPATISAWKTLKTFPSIIAAQKCWDESLLCQSPEVWGQNGADLQLLCPMYETMAPLTFFTLWRCAKLYGVSKIGLIPKFRTLIEEARNDLVQKFLLTKSEWCLFVDSDMVLPCGSGSMLRQQGLSIPEPKIGRNAIERIMSHPKEFRIVGGLYRDRRLGQKAQCSSAYGSAERNTFLLSLFSGNAQHDGLEKEGWIATGFIKIHRSVFEEMIEASKAGKLTDIAPPAGRENEPYGFFGRSAQHRGEDVAFGRRAEKIGVPSFLDLGCILGHDGRKIY